MDDFVNIFLSGLAGLIASDATTKKEIALASAKISVLFFLMASLAVFVADSEFLTFQRAILCSIVVLILIYVGLSLSNGGA